MTEIDHCLKLQQNCKMGKFYKLKLTSSESEVHRYSAMTQTAIQNIDFVVVDNVLQPRPNSTCVIYSLGNSRIF